MSFSAAAATFTPSATRGGLRLRAAIATIFGLFAFDNLLLLHFLGVPLGVPVVSAAIASIVFYRLCDGIASDLPPIPAATVAGALLVSVSLLLLGGEGHIFYANTDWQVRDAVLRDLSTNPWPFAYDLSGHPWFLRAPVGIYLLPGLFGRQAEYAMLAWIALRLTLLIALAWHLFGTSRERAIALGICVFFSGWDIVGTALYTALGAHLSWDHIEQWNLGYQYSSHVTQLFWVPHHAIAGWTCAIMFLLWRRGLVPVGVFAAAIPLVAIWSPLAIMGAIPFALFAALVVLKQRQWKAKDVGLAIAGTVLALPTLLYLQIDSSAVGMHLRHTDLVVWALCIVLEVLPFAWPLLRRPDSSQDPAVLYIVLFLLGIMPLIQVGTATDFQMRASIMPLAILAYQFASYSTRLLDERPIQVWSVVFAVLAISIGSVTPILEIRRAVMNQASPRTRCSLIGAWNEKSVPYTTYLVPVDALPRWLQNVPVTTGANDPERCWDRNWRVPIGA